jgi:ribosomal protein S18 acetylase RimI-like enzyme
MIADLVPMTPDDYDAAYSLWQRTEGMGHSAADSRENIAAFLQRNPGLSLVARWNGELVGTLLCGQDSRRGYLYHLAVASEHRGRGIGTRLVESCLARLAACGIQKCHAFVYVHNEGGKQFWRKLGCEERVDLLIMSRVTDAAPSGGTR